MTSVVTKSVKSMKHDPLSLHDDVHREVLPNGLTLLMRRDTTAPVVAIVTHVKAGYFDESDADIGIAHVLEHMFFKGTPSRGVGQIAQETKANGGYLNAHTIYDHTSYFTVLPSAAFVPGLEIQFDAFARSVIDGDELARELEVIVQEEKRKRDSAYPVAIEALYALLHDMHRIRRWRMGHPDALRAFTRNQVLSFYRNWYQPSNTILSIVGNVDLDVVRAEVMARHGSLESGTPTRNIGADEGSPSGFRFRDWTGDIAQQQIAFGWRAPDVHQVESAALDLGSIALASGRASRLYRGIREQQLASSVSAWNYTTGNIGVFVANAETTPARAPDAARALWGEVQRARGDGFRENELTRAKSIVEARWLRRLESMDGQATYLATWEAEGGLDLGRRYYDRLMGMSAEAVQRAMHEVLDPANVAIVSYRPTDSEPLAGDGEALRETLYSGIASGRGNAALGNSNVPIVDRDASPSTLPAREPATAVRPIAPARVDHGVHVFHTTLGIPILILPRPGAPITNFGVYQRGGACAEADGQAGLARLTAQAMVRGTTTRTGAELAEATEALGASIGVSAALESCGWSLSVPARHLNAAAELLADVVQHPVFPDEGVATERKQSLADVIKMRDDMSRWPMRLAIMEAFGEHPYARSVSGTEASLPLLDAESVRRFHRDHIIEAASVIAVVGDVDPEETAALCALRFDTLRWRDDVAPNSFAWPTQTRTAHEQREKQQTALALLFPGAARNDPERFAMQLISAIASGLGGRFFEQLRDKQSLAYTVSAFPVERRTAGCFCAYIATSPAREDEARTGLLNEFAKFRESPPQAEEIERAKRYLIGTNAISQQSGSTVLGEMVDAFLFGSGLHEMHAFDERIGAVTEHDMWAAAQRFFDPAVVIEGVVRGRGV